jgi:hypothetical protein
MSLSVCGLLLGLLICLFLVPSDGQVAIILAGLERGFFEDGGHASWLRYVYQPLQQEGHSVTMVMCVETKSWSDFKYNSERREQNGTLIDDIKKALNIETLNYYQANERERIEHCSEALYAHPRFDTFKYIIYTRPDAIWNGKISLKDIDPKSYRMRLRATMLLACPSIQINDDWLSGRGCRLRREGNNSQLTEENCKENGLKEQGINACILPSDQIAVVPQALARYYLLSFSNLHELPLSAPKPKQAFRNKMISDFQEEKEKIHQDVNYINAINATYGYDREYIPSCARAGYNIEKQGIKSPEGKHLKYLASLDIPFMLHPFPFRLNIHYGSRSKRWHQDWLNEPRATWLC